MTEWKSDSINAGLRPKTCRGRIAQQLVVSAHLETLQVAPTQHPVNENNNAHYFVGYHRSVFPDRLPDDPGARYAPECRQGQGAASVKICAAGEIADRNYSVTIRRVETFAQGPAARLTDSQGDAVSLRNADFVDASGACKMLQFAARPGAFAVTELRESYASLYPVIGTPTMMLTAAIVAADKKDDFVSFTNASGHLTKDAPTFEIRDGQVSRLGTIIFNGRFVFQQMPVVDKTGYWDGQTTETLQSPKLSIEYQAPVVNEPNNDAPIVGSISGTNTQTLTSLLGREIVLEEPPAVVLPQ